MKKGIGKGKRKDESGSVWGRASNLRLRNLTRIGGETDVGGAP